MSAFASVTVAPPIEVFNVGRLYRECKDANKVDLGVGAYRDDSGKPWVLPVVREAESLLAADATQNHEYLPVLGFEPFTQAATQLLLGEDNRAISDGRAFGVQCLSGTGSLRMGCEFLRRTLGRSVIYVSEPTWGNHNGISKQAGFAEIRKYRYWHADTRSLDFNGMLEDLNAAPKGAVILLHGCAHNPTGCDPTAEQWAAIGQVIKARELFPFFDIAYQGFASGNADTDAAALRRFVDDGHEMLIAQSFAKNFGLYNERIGNLCVVAKSAAVVEAVKSQISLLVRTLWSNPPNHGAKVVHMVLTTPAMRAQWHDCLKQMSGRIIRMRQALLDALTKLGTPGSWAHVTTQIGMFSYLGITEQQVAHMTENNHIFLLKSGRISICGLTDANVQHVANAIHEAVKNCPAKL